MARVGVAARVGVSAGLGELDVGICCRCSPVGAGGVAAGGSCGGGRDGGGGLKGVACGKAGSPFVGVTIESDRIRTTQARKIK